MCVCGAFLKIQYVWVGVWRETWLGGCSFRGGYVGRMVIWVKSIQRLTFTLCLLRGLPSL